MGSINDKLQYLLTTKDEIKTAIGEKGVEVADGTPLRQYPTLIGAITTGVDPEELGTLDVTGNGMYNAEMEGVIGWKIVNVNVSTGTDSGGGSTGGGTDSGGGSGSGSGGSTGGTDSGGGSGSGSGTDTGGGSGSGTGDGTDTGGGSTGGSINDYNLGTPNLGPWFADGANDYTVTVEGYNEENNENFDAWDGVKICADENLVPGNIAKGVTIFGVEGTLDPENPDTTATFTVTFVDQNGEELQKVENVPYGGFAKFTGLTPTNSDPEKYFAGWNPSFINIIRDTTCKPMFKNVSYSEEEIEDTWEEIVANKGAKYPIGAWKSLILTQPSSIIPPIVVMMQKVYEGEDVSTSTWLAKKALHRISINGCNPFDLISYPKAVANAIIPVTKYTRIYNNTSALFEQNRVSQKTIWSPSVQELFGLSGLPNSSMSFETLGICYSDVFSDIEIFLDTEYGLRSYASSSYCVNICADGTITYDANSGSTGYFRPGFCL